MPKKFGTNTKKDEAREREAQKKKEKIDESKRKAEDDKWKETDEKVINKLEKEKEKERKKQEAIQKKLEAKKLLEEEEAEILKRKTIFNELDKQQNNAPTRRDIEAHKERTIKKLLEQKNEINDTKEEEINVDVEFVNPNFQNQIKFNETGVEILDVTGVSNALEELEVIDYDKHPEKRMRAAWNAFYEKNLSMYKIAYPSCKRSQLIHLMQKEFKKSPENPVYKKSKEINK